jgi:hypothetical protein
MESGLALRPEFEIGFGRRLPEVLNSKRRVRAVGFPARVWEKARTIRRSFLTNVKQQVVFDSA